MLCHPNFPGNPLPGPHGTGSCHLKNDDLHVITVITNPVRYASRYKLYLDFVKHMQVCGVQLWTIELGYGERPFAVTDAQNPRHIQVKTYDELWHKENLINLAIQRLPADWKYVAWVDADIQFMRPDWMQETIQQLQHHHFVQMWETAIDLGPHGQVLNTHHSFISQYLKGRPYCYGASNQHMYYEAWHPGYAWAADRLGIEHVGGLIDTAILGAADNHMAHALVGKMDFTLHKGLHPNYYKHLKAWQDRAERFVRRDVGYVGGSIIHNWHGKKKDRKYHDRWKILTNNQFNPDTDLKRDYQGVHQLHDDGTLRSIHLRDDIRKYFRTRNEDSVDLY